MRSVPGAFLVFLLATLLVVTTPIGTGEGVHQDQLLHPVLPHLHMIDGRIVSHDETDAAAARRSAATRDTAGPALGAGTGAEAAGLGVALYPNVPGSTLVLPMLAVRRVLPSWDVLLPNEFLDAPPDPPPNLAG